jgi:hypothetical protein
MLAYRVFPHCPIAAEGEPGHPLYLDRHSADGRLDNPRHYRVWYLALEQNGAIGETFGNLLTWMGGMFLFPQIKDSRRALATYILPDETPLFDLDDSRNLAKRGLRPTQIVSRNRAVTQSWALDIFREQNNGGARRWSGVQWWSLHYPQWRIIGYWGEADPELVKVEQLDLGHPAVKDAARTLQRQIVHDTGLPSGHVFISYSRTDRAYVGRLAAHLTDEEIPVWYDYEMAAGDRFATVIQHQIDMCAAFIVVLTPASITSEWVDREIQYAEGEGKPVLPLLLEPCKRHILLAGLNHEDVTGGLLPSAGFLTKLRGLI